MKTGLTLTQIEERKSWIGGSDAHAIVSGDWKNLWLVKTSRAEPVDLYDTIVADPKTNRFMLKHLTRDRLELARLMGHATEALNCFWYEHKTGRAVTRRGELQRHPTIPYLACNLDGETTTSGGFPATFNAKHVGRAGDQLTLRHTAQCTHEALCRGYDWWVLSAFIGSNKWEPTEQEVDPFFAAEYLDQCAAFWGYVERDEEPPETESIVLPPPQRGLRTVLLEDKFKYQFPNWAGEAIALIRTFAETDAVAKKHAVTREALKNICPEDVGTITRGRFRLQKDRAGKVRMAMEKGGNDET